LQRRYIWPSAVLLVWVSTCNACLAASNGRFGVGVESAYGLCLSAPSSCKSVLRTQFRLQYARRLSRTSSIRIRVSQLYQLTLDDDKSDGSSEEQQASKLSPPLDVVDVRLRLSDPDGRDHVEVRAGYTYQHPNPSTAIGYHTGYFSGDYFFGPPISTGVGSLSRRWDVVFRVSQDYFATTNRTPEQLAQIAPTYTIPLNSVGSSRAYLTYAREQRFSRINSVRTPSNRFEVGYTRDPRRWLEFYLKIALWGTRGVPGTGKALAGVSISL
jgi:hypothetical protein